MNNNNFKFPLIIIAVILGATIFKHFDFKTLTFKESWLDVLFVITFVFTLLVMFKKNK
jgi:hypothetical protein